MLLAIADVNVVGDVLADRLSRTRPSRVIGRTVSGGAVEIRSSRIL